MKQLMIMVYCAITLAGCAHSAVKESPVLIDGLAECAHPLLGTFQFDVASSREAIQYTNGTLILTMDDGRKLQLIGAVCRIKQGQ